LHTLNDTPSQIGGRQNQPLPARARGHRIGNSGWKSGSGWALPGAVGLVERVAHLAKRATPKASSGGGRDPMRLGSAFQRVVALTILALGRLDGQPELFAQRAADEAADAVRLPLRRGHQVLERGSARALDQLDDLAGLAPLAGGGLLLGWLS